jgi:Ca2+-binding EF-hand superfamily protein
VLDHNEAKNFFNKILTSMEGKTKFGPNDFDSWILTLDADASGTIDKNEFIDFLTKTLAFEMGQSKV